LRFRTGTDGSALASPHQTQRQDHDKDIRNRSVFFIFLISLFGCAFAVLFVGRQNKSWKAPPLPKIIPRALNPCYDGAS
jgi:heme/copper-type cytochrome/quinol oxidase subunit 3